MGGGALWRDNQQSTFAHIHTSSIHSTNSTWSPIPYPHCVSTDELPRDLPPTKPLTDLYLDLLRPFLPIAAGSMHLVVIVDRFSKMTRMMREEYRLAFPSSEQTPRKNLTRNWGPLSDNTVAGGPYAATQLSKKAADMVPASIR